MKQIPALFTTERVHETSIGLQTSGAVFLPATGVYRGAFCIYKCDAEDYQAFVLNSEEDIDQFLDAFGISPTETNQLIDAGRVQEETQERIAIQEFIAG